MAKLKKGDTVVLKNRMYGVVSENGRLGEMNYERSPAIFFTRQAAREWRAEGERVIRLADVSGTIV